MYMSFKGAVLLFKTDLIVKEYPRNCLSSRCMNHEDIVNPFNS